MDGNVHGLHANTGAMSKNGADTITNSEYLATELNNLHNNVEGLMSIWRGLAADNFNKSYEAQNENFTQFKELLNELGEAIGKAASILNNTEEENANRGAHLF